MIWRDEDVLTTGNKSYEVEVAISSNDRVAIALLARPRAVCGGLLHASDHLDLSLALQ